MQDDIRDPRARHETTEPRATEPHIGPDHQLPPPKRSTGVRVLVWVVILLLFALLFWWVMHHRQAPAAAGGGRRGAAGATVTLTTATAKKGSIGVYLDAIGTVTPVYTTTIVSQVTGVINQVRYREGQLVHRGQPLIQIDPRPFQANVPPPRGSSSATRTCWHKRKWTSSATRMPGRAMPSPNRRWTIRRRSSCKTGNGQGRSGHPAV